jgi:hypothetical protein
VVRAGGGTGAGGTLSPTRRLRIATAADSLGRSVRTPIGDRRLFARALTRR